MYPFSLSFWIITFVCLVNSLPTILQPRDVRQLAQGEIDAIMPYIHFARSAYCPLDSILQWDCGESCDEAGKAFVVRAGGDSQSIPHYYVAYKPTTEELIVAHEGTSMSSLSSVEIPTNVFLTRFSDENGAFSKQPGVLQAIPDDVKVHTGYLEAHARSSDIIFKDIQTDLREGAIKYQNGTEEKYGLIKKVVNVGYSMGAALAVLEAAYTYLSLDGETRSRLEWKVVGVGLPLIGNQAFTDWYESLPIDLIRIANKDDPVHRLKWPGYTYLPKRLIHVAENGDWWDCTGKDSFDGPEPQCKGSVNPFSEPWVDHWAVGNVTMTNVCGRFAITSLDDRGSAKNISAIVI